MSKITIPVTFERCWVGSMIASRLRDGFILAGSGTAPDPLQFQPSAIVRKDQWYAHIDDIAYKIAREAGK